MILRLNLEKAVFKLSFINENRHSSRTSHEIGMKLGSVTKLDTRNTKTSKKFSNYVFQQIVTSLSFFIFMVNLQSSENWIPDVWFIKSKFSLTITFCFTKPANKFIKSLTQVLYYCFE